MTLKDKLRKVLPVTFGLAVVGGIGYGAISEISEEMRMAKLKEEVQVTGHGSKYTVSKEGDQKPYFSTFHVDKDDKEIVIMAEDSGVDCGIESVHLYRNDQEIGELSDKDFDNCEFYGKFDLELNLSGEYTYHAIVTDASNRETRSGKVTVDYQHLE